MISFFATSANLVYAIEHQDILSQTDQEKLNWLFNGASMIDTELLEGWFVGPRKEMITPWSTNAVEITQNMGLRGIKRIEEFLKVSSKDAAYDKMLQKLYNGLGQDLFLIVHPPDPIRFIDDIRAYNLKEGLALSEDEVIYLETLSRRIDRMLTDSEVFGFSQVNSEHCRHKIFNGTFVIDGTEMPESLFSLIKKTSALNKNRLVSAYKDNVAFIEGPDIVQFAPASQDKADFFILSDISSVISLKAETHNFPTTVEPFNGAATGSGGEIRDRMAGGKGSLPIAGTAVYMTSYPRLDEGRSWEAEFEARPWLYQNPEEILIKASNGASDFGNKFGQPLICGSVLTFEHQENGKSWGYDKVIMLAGGIGFARKEDSIKDIPAEGDRIIVLGGDNYRIGMGGGAVSSVATGEYGNAIELNAVQRSNPEMQKRAYNAIRALTESANNPIISIHDHGAGGHLNCLSELIEASGGVINLDQLPIGDPTLSAREIIGNESQERMGLVMHPKDAELLKVIAERERAPYYDAGVVTNDHRLLFIDNKTGEKPVDLELLDMFGKPPKTILNDASIAVDFKDAAFTKGNITEYLEKVLQLEAVACKDWLTNKVDRSVTGRVALQQTAGPLQLPLNNLGVVALDYQGIKGIATALGQAPVAALIDPAAGSRLAVAEALTNVIWAPIEGGIAGLSLSANWMWPCKQPGEDARLYKAVEALSEMSITLGLNVPTGKDSLSMTQKYPDGKLVYSPGTVIVTAVGEVEDIRKTVSPVLFDDQETCLLYLDLSGDDFQLGGSSLGQIANIIGTQSPDVLNIQYFKTAFDSVQQLIRESLVLAGHDISSGGLVTTLLEMCFARPGIGIEADLSELKEANWLRLLFSEKPGILLQIKDINKVSAILNAAGTSFVMIGKPIKEPLLKLSNQGRELTLDIVTLRDKWFTTSYQLDRKQCGDAFALERFTNYAKHSLHYRFPASFIGKAGAYGIAENRRERSGIRAAIIREKGVNGDREMAYSLYYAGFDVKDVHMTDLIAGRENLEDVNMIVFVGGFSNSDVLGSAKGWAGAFLYNEKARIALNNFYAREDTLSLGICNGCQVMVELDLIYPKHSAKPKMQHNKSHKFESIFLNVDIPENRSVMLGSLAGSRLGVWVAHGEGRFFLPEERSAYNLAAVYSNTAYPGNPNGSDYCAAALVSDCGRHLVMMPHMERSYFPWQWGHYPEERASDELSPWVEAFVNAREWISEKTK